METLNLLKEAIIIHGWELDYDHITIYNYKQKGFELKVEFGYTDFFFKETNNYNIQIRGKIEDLLQMLLVFDTIIQTSRN